ncbi:unnamed protein product [Timema podura]|uniref:Major facilitator superfamily (MFS) profile domain-containing protein n=1 Tax=Timema podura TaxID=61482 RepID=A0ABN7NGE2_TIMPD|nr:unnamed protein product [Timema podura]
MATLNILANEFKGSGLMRMVAGTFICGILADLFGRRTTLIGILLVNSLSSMCTSTVNKATSFEICRFFSSFR